MMPHILPQDEEVAQARECSFIKQGIEVLTGHRVTKVDSRGRLRPG